jgi:hypothetical protein
MDQSGVSGIDNGVDFFFGQVAVNQLQDFPVWELVLVDQARQVASLFCFPNLLGL